MESGGKKIVEELAAGNKNTLNDLYFEYSNRIYRFALGYLKSEDDSLDIVQEVFIRIWSNRNTLKKDTNLEAYIFTIAKNTIISNFRKKISEKEYLEHLRNMVVKNNYDTENQVDYNLLSEQVKELISQLPEQRQRIYILSKEKGLSNKAIAEELGISVKTVEDHITKARKFLKANLSDFGLLAILFCDMFN